MAPISLALVWHQHQPYYPDDVGGENPMPWVRLHATKDYLGMALHLEEVPEFRCTINLVPSLLTQLEAYVNGATDTHLALSRRPADGLSQDEACAILDSFFMAFPDTMIRPHPRYHELYLLRSWWNSGRAQALGRFRQRDLRDLQVWSNLAWVHPIIFDKDAELAEFRAKGRHYTEEEKAWFLGKQRALLARVIPLHRELAERGQVELTTTPYYHPILPLLLDKGLAREAMPDVSLPAYRGGYPEDAAEQVRRAVASHLERFGRRPHGMWPSEGSVCQALIPLLAEHGIRWIATDEEILACSTHGLVGRDSRGHVRNPDRLYRPWRLREGGSELGVIFRDHSMSDQVGFHYQRSPGPVAAGDFLGKVHAIGEACRHDPATIVPVILDGENCWEYYPDGGVSFLRSLYHGAVRDSRIRAGPGRRVPGRASAARVGHVAPPLRRELDQPQFRHLDRPPRGQSRLGRAAPGTGVPGQRGTLRPARRDGPRAGLGGDLHRRGLRLVLVVRRRPFERPGRAVRPPVPQAPAERVHAPGQRPAGVALHADRAGSARPPLHDQPVSFLHVKLDGRASYFEWIDAARYACGNDRGTMTLVARGLLRAVWFGFDAERLLIRVDTEGGPARSDSPRPTGSASASSIPPSPRCW